MSLRVTKITVKHLQDFLAHARPLDLLEFKYAANYDFENTAINELSDTLALVDEKHNVYAIGGYKAHVVWLLCTTRVEDNKIKFLRFMKKCYRKVIRKEGWLYNYVWTGNELHTKWLKYMGAEFFPEKNYKCNGQTFVLFSFTKKKGE